MVDFSNKDTAVEYHRKLWASISEKLKNGSISIYDIHSSYKVKALVLKDLGITFSIRNACPCCEYAYLNTDGSKISICGHCPVVWTSRCNKFMCIDYISDDGLGLFNEFESSDAIEHAMETADRISNLPVNESV